jgi:hypothetical protein
MQSVSPLIAKEGRDMSQTDSIRELSVDEIDAVAGGLSVSASADLGVSIKGLGKEVASIGKAVDSTVGGLVGDVGSLVSGVTGLL